MRKVLRKRNNCIQSILFGFYISVFTCFLKKIWTYCFFYCAGRDDKFSHCIIYYRLRDVMRQSTMVFTEQKGLENLYGLMEYSSDIERLV